MAAFSKMRAAVGYGELLMVIATTASAKNCGAASLDLFCWLFTKNNHRPECKGDRLGKRTAVPPKVFRLCVDAKMKGATSF